MVRISLLAAVAMLAAGVTGCTHCDTCDDFPVPCVGHNTGVPMAPSDSYTLNVGPNESTVVPAAPVMSTPAGQPAPPTGPSAFAPPSGGTTTSSSSTNLEPLPRSTNVSGAKAN